MSLIERALGKARKSPEAQGTERTAYRRPAVGQPARSHGEPQLHVSPLMCERLGLTPANEQGHQWMSEYRHIKRQVIAGTHAQPDARTVMVASALAGEGKSFIAANLARSLALEPDYTVLLVDADVVKPHVSRSLELVDRPGLMDALVDTQRDIESLVITTDIDGLSVLPAGSVSANAPEYLGSERMRVALEQLQSVPGRIVLIDSLPLLLTTEARALVPLVSQVLMVVRAESTAQAAVQQALDLLGPAVDVKLVLNAVVRTRLTHYLGYGYGYDYNYGTGK
ncbi:MAG: AAA family ATPase [Steroidobacteraceae bacterium]